MLNAIIDRPIIEIGKKEEETINVTPSEVSQVILPSPNKTIGKVNVEPIPSDYIKPIGEIKITKPGTFDVSQYKTANVTAPFDPKFAQLINGTLTEVTAEDLQGVTKINDYAFYSQVYLTKLELPKEIIGIGSSALQNTPSLRQPIFLSPLVKIGSDVFSGSGITMFKGYGTATPNVSGGNTFRNCPNLKIIEFNEGVLDIPQISYGQKLYFNKAILPSTCISFTLVGAANISLIVKSTIPPTIQTTKDIPCKEIFVQIESIDAYKSATNWVSKASVIYPFVQTENDLSTIDTTQYTKACVIGNDLGIEDDSNYKIYNYTNGEWVKE